MARIVLGVTGSVAAIRTPELVAALGVADHEVRVVATGPATYFFDADELGGVPLVRDPDEWPGPRYHRDDPILHIELRRWADLLIVAPLDANTLGKFALGLSDNLLSCLFRAWDFNRPVVLAPAMNALMWESPVTLRQLRTLLEDRGDGRQGSDWSLEEANTVFARHAPNLILVPPQSKRLACGDVGIGAMAEVVALAEVVRRWAGRVSELDDHPGSAPDQSIGI
jgi:phosphopantothenoylcysteine decarboxylase